MAMVLAIAVVVVVVVMVAVVAHAGAARWRRRVAIATLEDLPPLHCCYCCRQLVLLVSLLAPPRLMLAPPRMLELLPMTVVIILARVGAKQLEPGRPFGRGVGASVGAAMATFNAYILLNRACGLRLPEISHEAVMSAVALAGQAGRKTGRQETGVYQGSSSKSVQRAGAARVARQIRQARQGVRQARRASPIMITPP